MTTAARYITDLAANGRYLFTTAEAARSLGGSPVAVRAALRRLAEKKAIASPQRGFHVIVPPEYRRLGCLPPEQFVPQLLALQRLPYYVGLLSAAQYHGAAHQRPQQFQIVIGRPRPAISCGEVHVAFIARRVVAAAPVETFNTPRGPLRVSTPEVTALDLVGYPVHAGGLDTVATILSELAERIEPAKLVDAARLAPVPWAQRLGYLLELVGGGERVDLLAGFVREHAREYVPLAVGSRRGRRRSTRWRLEINATVEAEA
jgi:predicted transcriptional regulator of viral defense system